MPIGNLMCYVHFAPVCSVKCAASNIGGGHRTCVEYLITSPVGISYTLKIPDRRNITKSPLLHRILHNRSPSSRILEGTLGYWICIHDYVIN